MNNIVDRIRQIIERKGISERKFCAEIGVSSGFLSKVSDVGSSKVAKILSVYSEINPSWLLTGEGNMLINADKHAKEGVAYDHYKELFENDLSWEFPFYEKDIRLFHRLSMNELSREISILKEECRFQWDSYYTLLEAVNKLDLNEDLKLKFRMPPTWSKKYEKFATDLDIECKDISDKKARAIRHLIEIKNEYEGIQHSIRVTIFKFNEVAHCLKD